MGLAKLETKTDHSSPRPASFIPSQGPAIGLPSPLGSVMSGQKSAGRRKKDMSTPLLLTALVDAFSILVIFLLVQVSGAPNTFEATDGIKLPNASAVDMSTADQDLEVANLAIMDQKYVLNGKTLSLGEVKQQLLGMGRLAKTEGSKGIRLVIQADESADFDRMNPLLALTAEAGISKLEFAVQAVEAKTAGVN